MAATTTTAAASSARDVDDDEVSGLRRERDFLLDKVAEMEAETLASRVRTSQLQTELGSLTAAKRSLEEQLRVAVAQKGELNARIHDLHLQFVSGRQQQQQPGPSLSPAASTATSASAGSYSPLATELANRRLSLAAAGAVQGASSSTRSSLPPSPVRGGSGGGSGRTRRASDGVTAATAGTAAGGGVLAVDPSSPPTPATAPPLGALDGIVSCPDRLLSRCASTGAAAPDPRKVAAILREFNPVELQRHLLTTAVENKVLHKELAKASKSSVQLYEQLDKVKDENDDLRFQLAEKNIELEGTRARMRVLERLQQKTALTLTQSQDVAVEPPILPQDTTTNPILPLLALPMPIEDNIHHSSSTESAHDHVVGPQSTEAQEQNDPKKDTRQQTPKKRPSKIPLPGTKTLVSPKPPSGKIAVGIRRESPSGRSKVENVSLSGIRSVRDSSWKNRSDSVSSQSGKNRESPSGHRSSSLSTRNNSKESLSGNKCRDSLSAKSRSDSLNSKKYNCDSISSNKTRDTSQNSLSSNSSNKRDSISSKGKDAPYTSPSNRKGQHQMAARRVSNASMNRSNLIDHNDSNSKVLTASDSLEPKLSSSLASNTNAEITDEVLDHPGDSFSDSLNNIPKQETDCIPFKSTDTMPPSNSMFERHTAFQASNTTDSAQPFPWHSSSSEYFDSINNSGSMFNNISLLRSCSYYQEQQFINASLRHEGLAECDSLENKHSNENDASKTGTYSVGGSSTGNVWVKFQKHSTEW